MVLAGDPVDLTQYADAWNVISKVGVGGIVAFLLYCILGRKWLLPIWYVKELEARLATEAAASDARAVAAKADADARYAAVVAERDAARDALNEQNQFFNSDVIPLFTKGIAALADANREADHRRWAAGGPGHGT